MRCQPFIIAAALACCTFVVSMANAATECINQNAPNPIEVCVDDNGGPAVWVQQPNGRQYQYYGEVAWGSVLWLDGSDVSQAFSTGYFGAPGGTTTPVSNAASGSGTASDPYVITTIVDIGMDAVRMTQRITYVNGDRTIRKTWAIENTSAGTTFNDLRFFHGGDTYFGGEDSARSWYDADNSMVYVTNSGFDNAGFMGFFANPATPASHYFAGGYWLTHQYATNDGQLPDTTDSNYVDAGYMLQWNRDSLAPGQAWTFESFETWSPPGALQVLAPADDYVLAGTTVERMFKVHNLTNSTLTVDLAAAALPAGWTVALMNGSSVDIAGLAVVEVPVSIEVPAGAAGGTSRTIEVTAGSGSYTNASSTRLTVLQADYTISPQTLEFNGVALSQSSTLTITLMNGPTASDVQIGPLGTGNPLDSPFSISNDTCSNATVTAGGTCSVQVTFTRANAASAVDSFAWPILAPIITTQTIQVAAPPLPTEHTVTATAAPGGTIDPTSSLVTDGNTATFTVAANTGYSLASVDGCDGTLTGNTYTTGPVTSACTVWASFDINMHTVSASAGSGGAISPASSSVAYGSAATLTLSPDAGYSIESVSGCGGSLSGNTYTTGTVTSACAVVASFSRDRTTVLVTTRGEGNGGGGSTDLLFLLAALLPLFYQLWRTGLPAKRAAGSCVSRVQLRAAPFFITAMAILGAVANTATAAEVEGGSVRVGMHAGQARGDISESDVNSRLAAAGIDATARFDDRTRTAWQIGAGYDLTKYFGVTFGYTDLGDVGTRIEGDVIDVQETLEVAARATPHSASGYELGMIARIPVFSRLVVIGRFGAYRWESEYVANNIDGETYSFEDRGINEFYGLGFEVPLFDRWHITAGYTRYQVDQERIGLAGVGVSVAIR
jgi:hypothetical protein